MAKFRGVLGFVYDKETTPDVYTQEVVERTYRGDLMKFSRRWEKTEYLNDSLTMNEEISIVADSYLLDNLYAIKYVKLKGVAWGIQSITPERPRIILSIGGIYNGPQQN